MKNSYIDTKVKKYIDEPNWGLHNFYKVMKAL